MSSDERSAYLVGEGYKAELPALSPSSTESAWTDGDTERVFEGAVDSFDQPLVALDPDLDRMIASRESKTDFPDSFLWEDGDWENLTNNVDPFPEVTAARRIDFDFERRDGLKRPGASVPSSRIHGR